ncbi:MAG: RagB/SusD family nutrient uptake outer membrane protein [Prevotellaceae bacterium]|nr:RagB/SusD family nutrient uptake outer membrane protein [Prevotellaceae bacterium]
MKRYSIKIMAGVLFLTVCLSSCKDFLSVDKYFSDELKLDSIFAQKRYVEAYLWGTVNLFPDEGKIYRNPYTPGPLATDEASTLFRTTEYKGMAFVLGEITPDDLSTLNTWGNLYKIIRKCNTILARIDEAHDWTTSERLRVLGYTRFYRAYAYYQLLMDFGPPILLGDEILETNEVIEYYDRTRNTYDEAVEYICTELEEAAPNMPAKVSILDFGRPTKGAAYGLVARLRLIHASPLFNGETAAHTYFGAWTRKTDGAYYVTQSPEKKRWAVAAAAAKRVIELTDAGVPLYKLYAVDADGNTPDLPANISDDPDYHNIFPNGAKGIDPYRSYSEIFTGEAVSSINPELVWGRLSAQVTADTRCYFPEANNGWNGISVPQKIIDAYKMVDGSTIGNSGIYTETGFSSGTQLKSFSGYKFTTTGEVSNMYMNREARFYASIGFSECFWPCESTTATGEFNLTVKYYYGEPNGKGGVDDVVNIPPTGYVIKKAVHRVDAWNGTNARLMDKPFPIIRYAEILLSYAEALNNLGNESFTVEMDGRSQTFTRDVNEIKKSFNQVRYRAGLPGLSATELSDPVKVQANIETERMIEFLHENRRYYDVRRWGKYEETESAPIMGMNMDAGKDGFYQRVVPNTSRIGSRIVNKKMVFVPVPNAEIKRLPSLDQNPGW